MLFYDFSCLVSLFAVYHPVVWQITVLPDQNYRLSCQDEPMGWLYPKWQSKSNSLKIGKPPLKDHRIKINHKSQTTCTAFSTHFISQNVRTSMAKSKRSEALAFPSFSAAHWQAKRLSIINVNDLTFFLQRSCEFSNLANWYFRWVGKKFVESYKCQALVK